MNVSKVTMHTLEEGADMLLNIGFELGEDSAIILKKNDRVYERFVNEENPKVLDISGSSYPLKAAMVELDTYNVAIVSRPKYAIECLKNGKPIPAVVDDMAQIVGPSVKIVPGDRFNLVKGLKHCAAVLTVNGDLITCGRTIKEAYTCLAITEKNAEILVKSAVLGGAHPLFPPLCEIEHIIYLKKYSKPKIEQEMELAISELDKFREQWNPYKLTEEELAIAERILEVSYKMLEMRMVEGTWGNLSVRLDDTYMLCTPSGIDYTNLLPEDLIKVNYHTLEYDSDLKPTSEKDLHAGLYRSKPDINSIIHTHSKYCSIFAACNTTMEASDNTEVRCAKYAISGTEKLAHNTYLALGDNKACFLSHHGMVAIGDSIEDAFKNCALIELTASKYINDNYVEEG